MQNLCLQITKSQRFKMETCLLATLAALLCQCVSTQRLIFCIWDSQGHFLGKHQQWRMQQHLTGVWGCPGATTGAGQWHSQWALGSLLWDSFSQGWGSATHKCLASTWRPVGQKPHYFWLCRDKYRNSHFLLLLEKNSVTTSLLQTLLHLSKLALYLETGLSCSSVLDCLSSSPLEYCADPWQDLDLDKGVKITKHHFRTTKKTPKSTNQTKKPQKR